MPEILLWYVMIVNILAVLTTVIDKIAAKTGRRRVPEATLLWIAACGGAAAMLATMKVIRHKTRKPKFMIGLPLILVAHVLFAGVVMVWQCRSLFIAM